MSARSFFTAVRSHIAQNGECDPEGRYLAICLREAFEENRPLLNAVVGAAKGAGIVTIECEYPYAKTAGSLRRADLAVLTHEREAVALVEVKAEDSFIRGQLASYLEYGQKNAISFVLITRWPPNDEDAAAIARVANARWLTVNALYRLVCTYSAWDRPITALLRAYLEENEMIYGRYIGRSLGLLLTRTFVGTDKAWVVKGNDLTNGLPAAMTSLFSSLKVIGTAVRERLDFPYKSKMNVTLNMHLCPAMTLKSAEAAIKAARKYDDDVWCQGPGRHGVAYFTCTLNLGNSTKWYYLVFTVAAKASKSSGVQLEYYTHVSPDYENKSTVLITKRLKFVQSQGAWDLGPEDEIIEATIDAIRTGINKYSKFYAGKMQRYPRESRYLKKLARAQFD